MNLKLEDESHVRECRPSIFSRRFIKIINLQIFRAYLAFSKITVTKSAKNSKSKITEKVMLITRLESFALLSTIITRTPGQFYSIYHQTEFTAGDQVQSKIIKVINLKPCKRYFA